MLHYRDDTWRIWLHSNKDLETLLHIWTALIQTKNGHMILRKILSLAFGRSCSQRKRWRVYNISIQEIFTLRQIFTFFFWSSSSAKDLWFAIFKIQSFCLLLKCATINSWIKSSQKNFLIKGYHLWLIDNILSGTKLLTEKILQQSDPEQQINEQKMRLAIQAV